MSEREESAGRARAVRDVMSTDLVSVAPSTTVMEAARMMFRRKVGSALVLEDEALAGIFTERDIMRALSQHDSRHSDAGRASPVREWMTPDPATIEPDATVGRALDRMLEGGFRHLPVKEGDQVVGVVSMRDLAQALGGHPH